MTYRRWVHCLLFAVVLSASACADEDGPATAIVLTVKSDLTNLNGISLRIFGPRAELPRDVDNPISETTLKQADIGKPIVITKHNASEMLLVVRGLGPAGTRPLVEHVLRARFTDGKSIALPVFLARACFDDLCGGAAGQTCFGEPHAGLCPGSCGAVATPDVTFEVVSPGDELNWQPRSCAPGLDGGGDSGRDASNDTGSDKGDADNPNTTRDATPGTGDASPTGDAGACKLSVPGNPCDLATQCGCPAGKACVLFEASNADAPEFRCEVPGNKLPGNSCTQDAECSGGHGCIGSQYSACFPYCASSDECGDDGICLPVLAGEDMPIRGVSVCRERCSAHNECTTNCCQGSTPSEKICIPTPFCAPPTNTMCTVPDGNLGCINDADCCSVGGLEPICYTGKPEDAGPPPKFCVSSCSAPSDCPSGCCAPLLNNVSACVTRMLAEEVYGAEVGKVCVP